VETVSVRRRAAKRDANERPIIDALEMVGATVVQLSEKGAPDLLVGYQGRTYLLEVKGTHSGLTRDQEVFHEAWRGRPIHVVRTPEGALTVVEGQQG
jgi:Holliday junction resolvase